MSNDLAPVVEDETSNDCMPIIKKSGGKNLPVISGGKSVFNLAVFLHVYNFYV